jgi:quinohemoprotein amine dehydrogenase
MTKPAHIVTRTTPAVFLSAIALVLFGSIRGVSGDRATVVNQLTPSDSGIPIESDVVVRNCVGCHAQDSIGRMTRISFMRKAPEGWQTSIRRMVTLNNVQLDPETAREIVKYLSNRHGLAPEELRPGLFEVERRLIDYKYEADEETETTCKQCHSLGRVIIQRRTGEEWALLVAMHRGYYPLSDFQAFRRGGPPSGEDPRYPMDKAIAHLSKEFPLETTEWAAWSATMRPARLEGTWALAGHAPGKGAVYGQVVISANPNAADEFTTEIEYSYARGRGGESVTRSGRGLVYTGYQWRGRSFEGSGDEAGMREVMMVERGWQEISGRWFTGGYDELGLDVTLVRVSGGPVVSGVYPPSLRTGDSDREVRIYGANLPSDLSSADIDFGPGVAVTRVVSVTPEVATVRLSVASDATIGNRDLFLAGVNHTEAIAVYDEVSRIKVTPQAGMARIGGVNFPKQYQQYEAVAVHDGPDGEPDTDDDLNLGPVEVTWKLEEYSVTYDDDDLQFVGAIGRGGLFTPAIDGPNPNRSNSRNNVGDVWVVATYGSGDQALRARAHLLVTVPLYMRWEPWRVEQ